MTAVATMLDEAFGTLADIIREHRWAKGDRPALIDGDWMITYASLDRLMDRIAAALQRDGVAPGDVVAACAYTSAEYAATFLGVLRAGAVMAPLAPSSTPESLVAQLQDCGAKVLFLDNALAESMGGALGRVVALRVALDGSSAGIAFEDWLTRYNAEPARVTVAPDQPFNIIYSSGTTGAPKGIVQSHAMRWIHLRRGAYTRDAVTMISTPLYSNTTLVSFLPTLAKGGAVVLMPKFDAARFLALAAAHGATHAMLVPVQYRRLMDHPDFDRHDLSSFVMKFSTSAPFDPALKAEVLRRWPGGLTESYGMTEGGGTCSLECHTYPDKLHTVGRPFPGHDIRLIDDQGREVPRGEIGEVVGRSPTMMTGYHNQPLATAEAEWWSPDGLRFIRTGDIGRFDPEGFLTLMDRKKDMIISGGFNIYPSDLEAVICAHPSVQEAAVIGVPSRAWGETPVAFVALRPDAEVSPEALRAWLNAQVGKTQRLADLQILDALPRSHIGKVLKKDLREGYAGPAQS